MEWNFDDCAGELPTRIQKFHVEAIEKSPEWQALAGGAPEISQEDLDRANAAMEAAENDIAAEEQLDEPPF
jgi:hypothetical protein